MIKAVWMNLTSWLVFKFADENTTKTSADILFFAPVWQTVSNAVICIHDPQNKTQRPGMTEQNKKLAHTISCHCESTRNSEYSWHRQGFFFTWVTKVSDTVIYGAAAGWSQLSFYFFLLVIVRLYMQLCKWHCWIYEGTFFFFVNPFSFWIWCLQLGPICWNSGTCPTVLRQLPKFLGTEDTNC